MLISVLRKSAWHVVGYTDTTDRGTILGIPYLGCDDILPEIFGSHAGCRAIIGIGKIDVSDNRLKLQNKIEKLGFRFPEIVSPQAIVNEDISLGAGAAVFDGVIINSGTKVGRACILNTNCTVEHDCVIGDNVHIAPGVTLSGGVTIGNNSLIGTGATIIQSVTICERCLVGAGSTVVKNITVPGTYVGSPAQRIK